MVLVDIIMEFKTIIEVVTYCVIGIIAFSFKNMLADFKNILAGIQTNISELTENVSNIKTTIAYILKKQYLLKC